VIRDRVHGALGGSGRGPEQEKNLARPQTRERIGACIDEMEAADRQALALMKELLSAR